MTSLNAKPRAPGRVPRSTMRQCRLEARRHFRGPVPASWLEAAARLPGKSLHAGVALWHAASLARSASVPLSNISGLRFGLDRNAKYRALVWLEGAGLIAVVRKLGRAPVVTLLEASQAGPSSANALLARALPGSGPEAVERSGTAEGPEPGSAALEQRRRKPRQ